MYDGGCNKFVIAFYSIFGEIVYGVDIICVVLC